MTRQFQALMLWFALSLALLAGCQRSEEHSTRLYVFGTLVEVKLWGASQQQADRAFTELQQMFNAMHRDWHAWEPGRLVDINRAFVRGAAVAVDEQITTLVRRSQELETLSGGRFNPAIGGLVELWGFHTSEYPILGPPPTAKAIERFMVRSPSTHDIRIEGDQLVSDNPGVQLDFGGIAKGYAIDLAVAHLRTLGIDHAIVNAGGDLRAVGRRGSRPWRIAVRKPGGGVIGAVEVQGDEAVFTSGNYERFRQDAEERYPHILDPRSGWPVRDIASVTVVAAEGLVADAAATALIVAGLEEWPEVAAQMGLDQVLVVDEQGRVFLTSDMARRVRFAETPETTIVDP